MHITCLDNDPRLEGLLRRLLRRLGHELRFDCSVNAFKNGLSEAAPDLVLIDLGLGQESGIDVIHWLADQSLRLPIALLSGRGDCLLDTARRIALGRDLEVLGIINKARLITELPPVLEHWHRSKATEQHAASPAPPAPATVTASAPPCAQTPKPPLDVETLRGLIDQGAVVPYLQAIVDPSDGSLQGAETLARLRLPDGQILGAGDFIPLAEDHKLIYPITQSLVQTLIEQRQQLTPLGLKFIAINLPASGLDDQPALDLVRALVTGLGKTCAVHVEITETACSLSPQQTQSLAANIRLAGAKLSIDDFGTGYSSMRVLAELPFETLKIDLSFVSEMFDSPKALSLLRSIIAFGHNLELQLVAEGVETEAQRQLLVAEEVNLAQGFLFGRPMSIEAFVEHYTKAPASAGTFAFALSMIYSSV
ncbi:EAL domain-containing response regulator [Lamprobacter modestohalophilus]|uniref:EAL domain-containing response regulator n=1 Tax=Lamprobacter modestohalophilus TaxID=1064514 RepID=UPI002ADEB067|nr:EAL domain-containing response regulator [Lamprobacter modestohalophilus]MEA1048969.1 EAL domain-containing response regulator [Lamprobacter modestohalophilus]